MKLNNKKMIIITISIIILILLALGITGLINKSSKESDKLSITYSETGIPKFIDGPYTKNKIKNSNEALSSLNTLKEEMHFKDVEKEFELISEETNDNIIYYKFSQNYEHIRVMNHELIISVDKEGNVLSLSGYYLPNIDIDINSKITKEEAEEIVKQDLGDTTEIISNELFIYNNEEKPRLIYQVDVSNNAEIKEYIVDANTKEVIFTIDLMESASYEYTGEGLNGIETISIEEYQELMPFKTRYRFNDLNRKIEIKDGRTIGLNPLSQLISGVFVPESLTGDIEDGTFKISTGNNTKEEIVKDAITTMKNYEDIYDYYKNNLGRNSYDNKGSKIVVHIGVGTTSNEELENAFWLSKFNQMFIGRTKDKVSLSKAKDILGHEFTHGVISKTANFSKVPKNKNEANETAALNEGISDILGSLIEGKNWTIGEDVDWLIRDIKEPSNTNNPSEKGGENYYPDSYLKDGRTLEEFLKDNNLKTYDNGGEHKNATVVGHAAYLMEEKGAVKSEEQLAKLWYNSLFLMSSYSNFEDCALAVIKTAKNMGLSPSSIEIIQEAFYETKMLEKDKYKVTGTVTADNKEIANLKIILKNESDNKTYQISTNTKGEFEFKDLPKGKYTIIIENNNYKSWKKTFEMTNKDIEENIKLEKITSNNNDCDFYMEIDDIMNITMKGPALRGRIERGKIQIGDEVEIVGKKKAIVNDITLAFENKDYALAGEYVAIFLEGIEESDVNVGDTLKIVSCNNDNNYNRRGEDECFTYLVEKGEINIIAYKDTCPKDVIIPNTIEELPVTKLTSLAFRNKKITSVKLPNTLIEIGGSVFSDNLLKTVIIPNSVKTIESNAFDNNILEHVELGENIGIIGDSAFKGDYKHTGNNIKELVIPNNVNKIGDWAFQYNSITNLTLGNKLEKIGHSSFENNNIKELIIPNSVKEIDKYAFDKNNISTLVLSENLTEIKQSFYENNIKELIIPNSVKRISENAFGFNPLETVTIGKGVNEIGNEAFGKFLNKDDTLRKIINKSNNAFDWKEILFLMPSARCNGESSSNCTIATGTIIDEDEGLKLEITN